MNKSVWKKYLVNSIIILLFLGIVVFSIVYFLANDHNMQTGNETSLHYESVDEAESNAKYKEFLDDAFEGFCDITLCMDSGSQESSQPIKLFVQENNCYFFMPSYYDTNYLIIHFDQEVFSLSLQGKRLFDGARFKMQDTGILDIEILHTGAKKQYVLNVLQSKNLPAVFISTANKTMQYIHSEKDNTEPGNFVCICADGSIDCTGAFDKMEMHGNTSLMCQKKTYQIRFENDTNVLSMGSAKHWILQANAYDKSYLRNKLVYDLARQFGLPYAVEAEFADIYLNNEYAGCYLVCEKVEAGKNRVDIPVSQIEENNNQAELVDEQDRRYYEFSQKTEDAKGYLIEANNKIVSSDEERIDAKDCYFTIESGIYEIKSPKRASQSEVEYLTKYMEEIEKLIAECALEGTWKRLESYIDIDSFAVMYLLDIITNEVDANDYSTFYYILHGKMYAGPAWDYDRAFGNEERNLYVNLNGFPNGFCEALSKNKKFRQYVTDKFNQQAFFDTDHPIFNYLEEAEALLFKSINMNEIRWKNDVERINYSYNCFEDEVSYLKYYYRERLELVDALLNKPNLFHTVTFTNSAGRSKDCWILDGEALPQDIMNFMKSQYGCMNWSFKNGDIYQQGRPIFSDMILYAVDGGYE